MLEVSDNNDTPLLNSINKALGNDFAHLIDRCNAYKNVLLKRRHDIAEKIKFHVDEENPDGIYKILNKVQAERLEIISLRKEVDEMKSKYFKFKGDIGNFRSVFQKLILNLKYKCNKLVYFACLRSVICKSKEIKKKLKSRYENEAIIAYKILCKLSLTMNTSPCTHLVSYINTVVYFWHCVLERYYSEDFETILKQIKWPFIMSDSSNPKLDNYKQNFQKIAIKLIKAQLPENDCFNFNTSSTSELTDQFAHISLPIAMLIVPFRKRFFYHFTGKKQTNQPDKPEWYFSRVLNWIREYRNFLVEWLGPVYEQNGRSRMDSQHEFAIGLMQSVVVKLESDLSYFQLEDTIFSHIIDETLLFEHELKEVYGYPNDYPSVTDVLAQADIFFKWINLERKYAFNTLNTILSKEEQKWNILVKDKQYIITQSADSFLTLLNTMTDRYNVLRQPRHKIQFLKLQIDLLEEFKTMVVLLSVENKQPSEYLQEMLCTIHFVRYTLLNWGTNMNFLSLLSYKCELQYQYTSPTILLDTAETVFDETIKSYDSEIDIFSNYFCEDTMTKVKRLGKQYKKDDWHTMNQLTDMTKYSITDSGWLMYEQFTESLNTLNTNLPISVFNKIWPVITDKFATFIYNDILLANIFNCGGAQHLYLDIKFKIIPVVSLYTTNPNIYVERLLEACKVLCFEPNFKPVILTQHEVSEILLRRIEYGNSLELT